MNNQAAAAFARITESINSSLEALQGLAEGHFAQAPDCVNWGHVGTLAAIKDDIESAAVRANALACHEREPRLVARTETEPQYHVPPAAARRRRQRGPRDP